jgi:hypothetical protein
VGLFNLKEDPGERKNLAKRMPALAADLLAELKAWQEQTAAPIPSVANPECVLKAGALQADSRP